MAIQGPFAVIADSPAPDVVEALRAAGAYPIVETSWTDAPAALASIEPEAVVAAEPCPDQPRANAVAKAIAAHRVKGSGFYMPVLARARDDGASLIADALAIAANMPPDRIVGRLSAALRIRALHGTVMRRIGTLTSRGEQLPELPASDPLDEATVLIAGRGRTYPALSVAVGEKVGLVGALSVESAARALNVRDIDGMVIGDGFAPRVVRGAPDGAGRGRALSRTARDRARQPSGRDRTFAALLANLDRISEGRSGWSSGFLPLCPPARFRAAPQAHAQIARRQRHDRSQYRTSRPRSVLARLQIARSADAEKRGVGLTIARFSFDGGDPPLEPSTRRGWSAG